MFGVHFLVKEWFMHTHYVSYFTQIILDCFTIWSVWKSDTIFSLVSVFFWKQLVIQYWFKHTRCVEYSINIHFICFVVLPVHKADTFCYITYSVDYSCVWSLKNELSIHIVLAVLTNMVYVFLRYLTSATIRHSVLPNLLYFSCIVGH